MLISLGTGYEGRTGFFRSCADAFAGAPWHVVMSVGPHTDPAALGAMPPNVEVRQWVPYMTVLRHCRVVVTHGGMGTMMESFHEGRPVVVVPQTPDGMVAAERVAELGLGRTLDAASMTADGLRDAVVAVADDAAIGARVDEMRDHIARAGGARRAADAIEAHCAD